MQNTFEIFEPTVLYCGEELDFQEGYDERVMPKWDNEAQHIIDAMRKIGKKCCVIHKGNLHGLYSQ
jgi:hypothetical protein